MDTERETDRKQSKHGGPLPGMLRSPLVFLAALLVGILLNWAWPLPLPSAIQILGPAITVCSVLLFTAFLPSISRSGYTCTRIPAHNHNRANGSLPIQSQSDLFVFHPARARVVNLDEECLAAHNAYSRGRPNRGGCHSARRGFS